jgi:hypothetical protein
MLVMLNGKDYSHGIWQLPAKAEVAYMRFYPAVRPLTSPHNTPMKDASYSVLVLEASISWNYSKTNKTL